SRAYPVEREDYNIEMTLFLPISLDDRDPKSQAAFVKDNFYSVGGKIISGFYEGNKRMTVSSSTHVMILNKVEESNKCLLKVSLVGIPQEVPNEIKGDTIVQILVSAYVDNIRPRESFIFVVGQLEIIRNEFYVYARDINRIDAQSISKKNVFDCRISQSSSFKNSIRSKLMVTHNNFNECSKGVPENGGMPLSASSNNENRFESKSSNVRNSSKRVRFEDFDNSVEEFCEDFAENLSGRAYNETPAVLSDSGIGSQFSLSDGSRLLSCDDRNKDLDMSAGGDANEVSSFVGYNWGGNEGFLKNDESKKRSSRDKGKERADGSLRVNLRSRGLDSNASKIKE
ncbi:10899_t:CDS:2, partial [Gigaspora rosea]